jgi:hypothetical protein
MPESTSFEDFRGKEMGRTFPIHQGAADSFPPKPGHCITEGWRGRDLIGSTDLGNLAAANRCTILRSQPETTAQFRWSTAPRFLFLSRYAATNDRPLDAFSLRRSVYPSTGFTP